MNPASAKPREVLRAVTLLYISIMILFISDIFYTMRFRFGPGGSLAPGAEALAVLVVWCTILSFLVTRISAGKNWARITYLIFAIAEIPFTLSLLFNYVLIDYMFIDAILVAIRAITCIVALYFIFTAPGKHWFRTSNLTTKGAR